MVGFVEIITHFRKSTEVCLCSHPLKFSEEYSCLKVWVTDYCVNVVICLADTHKSQAVIPRKYLFLIWLTNFTKSYNHLVTNFVPIRTFCLLKEKSFCIIYTCEWSPWLWSPLYVNEFLYPHAQIYPIASGFWPETLTIHESAEDTV